MIGRCAGRMEFGQRALGNRSILADPRNRNMDETNNLRPLPPVGPACWGGPRDSLCPHDPVYFGYVLII